MVQITNLSACLCMLCILVACTVHGSATPPPSTQNPPLYPDARQVQVRNDGIIGNIPIRVISFQATADPEDVLAFYKEALPKEQWLLRDTEDANKMHFSWNEGCPLYGLDITVKSQGDVETYVELRLVGEPCH